MKLLAIKHIIELFINERERTRAVVGFRALLFCAQITLAYQGPFILIIT